MCINVDFPMPPKMVEISKCAISGVTQDTCEYWPPGEILYIINCSDGIIVIYFKDF